MARKPRLSEEILRELATYLANPKVRTEIHAEMKPEKRNEFENMYRAATGGYQLPNPGQGSYIVLQEDADKQGIQLRIYCDLLPNAPASVVDMVTDQRTQASGTIRGRINGYNIVEQILECGFVLGLNSSPQIVARIQNTMQRKFP